MPEQKTRLFHATWDNSIQVKSAKYTQLAPVHVECVGTHYITGVVTLDNGVVFGTMQEMEQHFKSIGVLKIEYLPKVAQGEIHAIPCTTKGPFNRRGDKTVLGVDGDTLHYWCKYCRMIESIGLDEIVSIREKVRAGKG